MACSETDLIERYFRDLGAPRADVALGIGDDAALVQPQAGTQLVLTTDALIDGVHFIAASAPARSIGHRALAVNLSDIAAMGATPSWALLSLNLPRADESWLSEFAAGFGALARQHGIALVGGNLSRGSLSITLALCGLVPTGQALRRDGALVGDDLYVSGSVGDAAEGLRQLGSAATDPSSQYLRARFEYPTPRVRLGQALSGVASACIDVSDGLYADASRLLQASGCGAEVQIEQLPLSQPLRACAGQQAWRGALQGGEDYELCFTANPARAAQVAAAAASSGDTVTRIGRLRSGHGLTLRAGNTVMQFSPLGFDHFRE